MVKQSSSITGQLREKLSGKTGKAFWRSLEELSSAAGFHEALASEYPAYAPDPTAIGRRSLLKVMAASLALAGLTGCDGSADESALPYVKAPEFVVPGKPKWYATAARLNGYAQPVLGKTDSGRPIKLEPLPNHPALHGAGDAFSQAALLGLYDPDRSQAPRYDGRITTWASVDEALTTRLNEIGHSQGEGLRLLTGSITSPTMTRQLQAFQQRWPKARWHRFEPIDETLRWAASEQLFGRPLDQHLRLEQAAVVISFDDDILGQGPRQAIHAHAWADRRFRQQSRMGDSRLFVAEPILTVTGSMAEERLILSPSRINLMLNALSAVIDATEPRSPLSEVEQHWLAVVVKAMRTHPSQTMVTIGADYPAETQAFVLGINQRLGAIGTLLQFTDTIAALPPDGGASFNSLVRDMAEGQVQSLLILDCNPVYAAGNADFQASLDKVSFRLQAGLYYDETAARCQWHLPIQHDLETWSDARTVDGTTTILQPLVRPFYDTRSTHGIMTGLYGLHAEARDIVRATWQQAWGDRFEAQWADSLHQGFVADSAAPIIMPPPMQARASLDVAVKEEPSVIIRPDPTIWDGRFANNAWLQELPKPLSKITWSNVISVSPALAAERHIENGDEVQLTVAGQSITGAIWIMPGQAEQVIGLTLGYGRTRCGVVGEGIGYDAFPLAGTVERWNLPGPVLKATGNRQTIATTQLHQAMDGFDFVRTTGLPAAAEMAARGQSPHEPGAAAEDILPSFYPYQKPEGVSWGMSIDLDLCIGCNACVVACMAENNIPVVGKDLVAEGREMHWLRIDHYYEGDPSAPKSHFQPVPCMHCEQAPCEMGCPVNAAVHSFDGLNLQVYNRCIGTRTCSSYCPYKVRHFNWFDYTADAPEQIKAIRNPDVTVRQRGVMEKCTYCVQRISAARIAAEIAGEEIADGAAVTACQQACPTQAIVFGNIVDANSRVSRKKSSPRNYSLLEEANTRPRTTYLAKIETGEEDG